MTYKTFLALVLWAFVGATFVGAFFKNWRSAEAVSFPNGNVVALFHATVRCPTCRQIERATRDVLAERDATPGAKPLQTATFDYEASENREIAEKFRIATATVLLAKSSDGRVVETKNLVEQCWSLIGDEETLKAVLRKEIAAFFDGRKDVRPDGETTVDLPTETLLDPTENLFKE